MPEISAARYRAGEGEPLALIHGFTATWRCWLPVIADLVPRFDVFAPTLTGHDGGPPRDPAPMSIAQAGDHLEAMLDEAGIEQAHFVGNSMGGALSIEMAKRGRALSVCALSPGGGFYANDRAEQDRIRRFFVRQLKITALSQKQLPMVMKRPGSRKLALRDVMRHGELVPPAEAVGMARSSLKCTVTDDVLTLLANGGAALVDLDKVTCPTLIAWAEHDRVLHQDKGLPRLRSEIPHAQIRVLPGCGHLPTFDNPGLVVQTILDSVAAAQSAPATESAAA